MAEKEDNKQQLQLHDKIAVANEARAEALWALREVQHQRNDINLPKGTKVRKPVGVAAPGLSASTPALLPHEAVRTDFIPNLTLILDLQKP
jgi:hypothetical protein